MTPWRIYDAADDPRAPRSSSSTRLVFDYTSRLPRRCQRHCDIDFHWRADPAWPSPWRRSSISSAPSSAEVAQTVSNDAATLRLHGLVIVIAGLLGMHLDLRHLVLRLPSSSSHALISGLVGSAIAAGIGVSCDIMLENHHHPDDPLPARRLRPRLRGDGRDHVDLPRCRTPARPAAASRSRSRVGRRDRARPRPADHPEAVDVISSWRLYQRLRRRERRPAAVGIFAAAAAISLGACSAAGASCARSAAGSSPPRPPGASPPSRSPPRCSTPPRTSSSADLDHPHHHLYHGHRHQRRQAALPRPLGRHRLRPSPPRSHLSPRPASPPPSATG